MNPHNPYDPSAEPDLWASYQRAAGEPDTPPHQRRLRFTSAKTITMRPVHWFWHNWIPAGAVTLMPGREGIGKSLNLVWLAARVTRGELPGIHQGQPRAVIYAATEDSWERTIAPRLHAAGADLDYVYRVDVITEDYGVNPLTLPRDCLELEKEILEREVALIALDPLMSVIDIGIDTHRDRELRTALEPLNTLADRTNVAVVGLAHFNKSSGTDPLNLVTGSRAFTAVIRAAIGVIRDPEADDGSCVLTLIKNNLGRLDVPSLRYIVESAEVPTPEGPAYVGRIVFLGEAPRTVHEILLGGDNDMQREERHERDATARWIQEYLKERGGEAAFKDLLKAAREAGIAEATLRRARTRAHVVYERIGFPGQTVWRLEP